MPSLEAELPAQKSTIHNVKSMRRRRRCNMTVAQKAHLLSIIRKLKHVNQRLLKAAVSDDLTCALNRRSLPVMLKAALIRAKVSGSVSLCLFDIDHFKTYNDSHGHPVGDEALRRIAQTVQSNLRSSTDKLFRCGGDEFCILFTSQTPVRAMHLIERLRLAIQQENDLLPHANGEALTVSFGLVWQGGNADRILTPAELYTEADRMLYEAKDAGRGQIRQLVLDGGAQLQAAPRGLADQSGSSRYPASWLSVPVAANSVYEADIRMREDLARHAMECSG